MKGSINFFVLLVLLSVGLVWGKHLYSKNTEFVLPKSSDEKIQVVQEFWQEALKQGDIEKYIVPTPDAFYDENSRCSVGNKTEQGLEMKLRSKEDGFTRGLRKTAREIGNGKFTLLNTKIYRQWESEAIIDADFARTEDHNLTEKRFFFLILTDGKWKVFMDTSVPNLINKEYANSDCFKETKTY